MKQDYRSYMSVLAQLLDVPILKNDDEIDVLLPYLEKMRREGAVIVLKLDGQRSGDDTGAYTAVVSGGGLGDSYFRIDATSLVDAAMYVIVNYARSCWSFPDARKED